MVNVIKFSEFASVNLNNTSNKVVGVSSPSGGFNFQSDFIVTWTTAGRPTSPYLGLQGFNSSLGQPEYWNGSAWVQLAAGGSGSVNSGSVNQLSYYATTGTAVSGLNTANNAVLKTDASGVPAWLTTTNSTVLTANSSGVPTWSSSFPSAFYATKAQQIAATSTTALVTPSTQQYHPSAALAWAFVNGSSGALNASYNIASVTPNGAGNYTVTFTVPMSSVNYCAMAIAADPISGSYIGSVRGLTTNTFQAQFVLSVGANPAAFMIVCFGQQ